MYIFKSKPLPQRSKSGRRWPRWLRCARLFRFVLFLGIAADRLWRRLCSLMDPAED